MINRRDALLLVERLKRRTRNLDVLTLCEYVHGTDVHGRTIPAFRRPRCGARSKRTGKPCRAAAMPNGRCKVHGGKSTGPRTPEGLERSRRANWKHGYYSREAKTERSRVRAAILALRYLRNSI